MTTFHLKTIAFLTMIIDHIGAVFFPNILLFRYIGRFAFPIYSFFIAEGLKKTSNIKSYLKNLFIIAFISEIFYDLCFNNSINIFYKTNTVYTLFIASVCIYFYKNSITSLQKVFYLFLGIFLSYTFMTDYDVLGVTLVYIFYFNDNKLKNLLYGVFWVTIKNIDNLNNLFYYNVYNLPKSDIYQTINFYIFTIIPFFIILFYNGKKGKNTKYMFYILYPLHLVIIYVFKAFLLK